MPIPRYCLECASVDTDYVPEQYIRKSTSGNIIFVNDLIKVLRSNLSESPKSSFDKGVKETIESLLRDLGA
jgi:hypothetical protein